MVQPTRTGEGPLPNETQPQRVSTQPTTPERQPSPIEAEITERLESLQVQSVQVETQAISVQNRMAALDRSFDPIATLRDRKFGLGLIPVRLRKPPELEVLELEQVNLAQDGVRILRDTHKAQTQMVLAQAVPLLVFNELATLDSVMADFAQYITTPEDREIVTRAFNHAQQARNRLKQSLTIQPEEYLAALGSKRNITVYGLTALSSAPDLLGFIKDIRAPQLPAGGTIEDLREVFGQAGVPADMSMPLIQDVEEFTRVIRQELDTLTVRFAMWEADTINAMTNGTFAQQLSEFKEGISFFDNPGLYIGLPMSWMQKNYWQPFAGKLTRKGQALGQYLAWVSPDLVPPPGSPAHQMASFFGLTTEQYNAFEGAFVRAKESGESSWIAYGLAFEEANTNWVSKAIVELFADPSTYFGIGVAKLFKGLPVIYPAVRGMENGWVRVTNMPFIALQRVFRALPKSPGNIVARDSFGGVAVLAKWLNSAEPRSISFMEKGMPRNRANMNLALEALRENPHHSGEITDAARLLTERPMYTTDETLKLAKDLGADVAPEDLLQLTQDIDAALSYSKALPGGAAHEIEETIDLILHYTNTVRTDAAAEVVGDMIIGLNRQITARFNAVVNAPTVRSFIEAIIRQRKDILSANQLNPLSAYRSRTAMLMAGMAGHNRVGPAVTTIVSALSLANRLSYGFTRMYLMSTMYGPANILETAMKSVVLRINPFYRGSRLRELRTAMQGFEDLVPRIFVEAEGFLLQAQDIANAGGTARVRDAGTRQAFRRIWGSKINILRKLYASADATFVQSSSRIGIEQAANVQVALIQRHLFENSQTGPIVQRIYDLVAAQTEELRTLVAPEMLEGYRNEMARRAIQDAGSLDVMAAEYIPGYGHSAAIQEFIAKYPTIVDSPAITEHLKELAISDDLWRLLRTGELDTRITEAIWQQIFAEPEVYLVRIRELTRAILEIPPDSLESLQVQTRMLEELNEATVHVLEQQMSATQAYTRDILNLQIKNDIWEKQWKDAMQPIMVASEDASRQIVESLRRALREKGFNLPQQAINQYDDLIHKQLLRMQINIRTRKAINEFTVGAFAHRDNVIIPRITRAGETPNSDHPEIRAWWQEFGVGRDRLWQEASGELAESLADMSAIAGSLDAFPLPQPRDVSARPIVMADIAYLYGSSIDSVTQGMYLTDLKMMRPKAEWVNVIYAQARRISRQTGANPEALGYSKSRLGILYDQHLNALKINPAVQNLSAPRFREWHALQVELQSYGQARGIIIKPGAQEALDRAAKGLLDDLGADPLTREVLGDPTQPLEMRVLVNPSTAQVADAEVGQIVSVRGRRYELVDDPSTFGKFWERQPFTGSQPGIPNIERLAVGDQVARGKKALLDRLALEERVKGLDPLAAGAAEEFVQMLPDSMLADLGSSFFAGDPIGRGAGGPSLAGFYDPDDGLVNIVRGVVNMSDDPERVIIHEISHHLEQFVPDDKLQGLRAQWRKDLENNGADVIAEANRLRGIPGALSDADKAKIEQAYRFENGFQEWFAEVMSDKALRDIFEELPLYRNFLQRVFDFIADTAMGVYNFLLRKGRTDAAEKVYRGILAGDFPTRLRGGSRYRAKIFNDVLIQLDDLEGQLAPLRHTLERGGIEFASDGALLTRASHIESPTISGQVAQYNRLHVEVSTVRIRLTRLDQESRRIAAEHAEFGNATQQLTQDIPPTGGDITTNAGVESVWKGKRRAAFKDAVDEYNLNFPVYDQNNAINSAAKFLFPFWTYEAHRWSYLPRIALRHPGLTNTWGRYSDSTDRGYIPIPGTSLQLNPLRNTIMMGGMQRWVNRDFPEFYDQYPDLANTIDQLGRAGFYPNVFVSGLMAMPLSNKAGIWQTGELIPPPIGSALEAIIALDPDNAFANELAEVILPNRFRDYRIAVRMAEAQPEGQGTRAADILLKRQLGQDLTDEEQQIWDSAERRSSLDSIVDYQIGMFRLRPEEMTDAKELAKQTILQYLPISDAQYDEARKTGMPIESYYPFPPELSDALRAVDEIARWRGLTDGLRESAVGMMLAKQDDYWSRVETRRDAMLAEELELDRRFRMTGPNHITRNDWLRLKTELNTNMRRFTEDLKVSEDFKDVPIEFDDRVKFALEHKTLAPIRHPLEESIAYYFSHTPDDFRFFDPELGAMATDWDGFFKWKATLENGQGTNRQEFLTRTRRWDTDLDTNRRNDYETFIRPYRALFDLTLAEFTDTEQAVIRQFYSTDSINVRRQLQEVTRGEAKVVSTFQRSLSDRRRRLRMLDPETDARLAFWGETTSVTSTHAQGIHDNLYTRYGIQEREVIPVIVRKEVLEQTPTN